MGSFRLQDLVQGRDRRLRTGWRLLLSLLCYAAAVILATLANRGLRGFGMPRAIAYVTALAIGIGVLLGFTWLLRRTIDRREWSGMALGPLLPGLGRFGIGAVLGMAMIGMLFGVMWASRLLEVLPAAKGAPGASPNGLLLGLAGFLAVGFEEELLMRGYIFQNLAEAMPLWPATLVTGLVFAGLHAGVAGWNLRFAASVVVISSLLVILRLLTGSLWTAIGWHFAWDWTQDTLLGMSGQGNGRSWIRVAFHGPGWLVGTHATPEGGMLWIALELIVLFAVLAWRKRRGQAVRWHGRLLSNGEGGVTR